MPKFDRTFQKSKKPGGGKRPMQVTVAPRLTASRLARTPADSIPLGYTVRLVSVESLAKTFGVSRQSVLVFLLDSEVPIVQLEGGKAYFNLATLERALYGRLGPDGNFEEDTRLYKGVLKEEALERARTALGRALERTEVPLPEANASKVDPGYPPIAQKPLKSTLGGNRARRPNRN